MELQEPRLQTPERPVPLAGIYKAIKRFNRNTTWVATGLLAPVMFRVCDAGAPRASR